MNLSKAYVNKYQLDKRLISSGFTLIEMVVVLILTGILAAYALPNLDLDNFRSQGFEQQSLAMIRYGHKQAIGSGCHVIITVNPNNCTLDWNGTPVALGCPVLAMGDSDDNGNGLLDIRNPASGLNNFCDGSAPLDSSNLPSSFAYDGIGRPFAVIDINVPGAVSTAQTVDFVTSLHVIAAETGFSQ